jgi:hypothetical protein
VGSLLIDDRAEPAQHHDLLRRQLLRRFDDIEVTVHPLKSIARFLVFALLILELL